MTTINKTNYFKEVKNIDFKALPARYRGMNKMHTQNLMEAMCYNLYRSPGIIAFNNQ